MNIRFLFSPLFRGAALALSAAALLLVGCGEPEKTAADGLKERHYGETVGDYLLAVEAGDLAAVRLFHELGMATDAADESGTTALMRAAASGQIELVEILLNAGADPKLGNLAGRTPLMFGAESGRDEVVRALLSQGADLNAADKEGWTALKLAAFHDRAATVDILAARSKQDQLDQALLVASTKGNPGVLGHLLTHGAYVNTRNQENLTPLMIAAKGGYSEAVKVLLRNQANPFALDDSEHTAANLAELSGHLELRDLLLDPSAIFEIADAEAAKDLVKTPQTSEDREKVEEAIVNTLGALVGDRPLVAEARKSGSQSPLAPSPGVSLANTGVSVVKDSDGGPRIAPIAGRTLAREKNAPGDVAVVDSLKLKSYREAPLPVMLKSVESTSGTAKVRVLSSADSVPIEVREGEMISGTSLKVVSVDAKHISSKLGNGHLVDVSRILVEDTRSGAKHLLIKDVPGRSNQTYATLTLPGSPDEYVVKNGDTFRAVAADDREQDYEVLDVRPTQVVIRNVSTDEVMTVNREGLAMR